MKLVFSGLSKTFAAHGGAVEALGPVDLEIGSGEFVCFVGPSGCGKSTLLSIVAGFEHPTAGTATIDGEPIPKPGPDRGMLFQEGALFPWLTARGNVEFPLRSLQVPKGERRARAEELLRLVHLADFIEAPIHELSGGMRQRVALARALAGRPRMILMDEPFAALDAITRERMYAEVQEILGREKTTALFITHNVREAVCLGDRVIVLTQRPGRIAGEIAVPLPRPRTMNMPEVTRLAAEAAALLRQEAA